MTTHPKSKISVSIGLVLILSFLLVWFNSVIARPYPASEAVQGHLDLERWDFALHGAHPLDGEWEFYWERLLEPADFAEGAPTLAPAWIKLPHSWNKSVIDGKPISGAGFATFRLRVQIPEMAEPAEPLALKLPLIYTSYKLWINGTLLAETGTVGTDRFTSTPLFQTRLVAFTPQPGGNEIILQAANFHHAKGGVLKQLEIGTLHELSRTSDLKLGMELFLAGSLMMMGLYHLGLYAFRRKDLTPLYFGLLALIVGMRTLLVGETIWTKIFPHFPWEFALKLEYWTLYMGFPLFLLYVRSLYPQEMPGIFPRLSMWTGAAFSLVVLMTPGKVYTHTLVPYELITLIWMAAAMTAFVRAWRNKRDGAPIVNIAALILFATIINDYLYYNEKFIYFGSLTSLGILLVFFANSYILSVRFSRAFAAVEVMSQQLEETNKRLEEKVADRTANLEETNRKLKEAYLEIKHIERSRRQMLANIVHDLRTPLASIRGYAEAVVDDVEPSQRNAFLRLIYNKTTDLNELVEQLFLLSQLENKAVPFDMRPVDFAALLAELCEPLEIDVRNAELDFSLNVETQGAVVTADPARMKQVLVNLLLNAIEHTPPGGAIRVTCVRQDQELIVSVADTGAGIEEERLPFIFNRFFTTGKVRPKSKGLGLGLAICREIVEAHGGRIWAESRPGKGSTIFFSQPVHASDEPGERIV